MEINEAIQDTMQEVVNNEEVKENVFKGLMNNQKMIDGFMIVGVVGGTLYLLSKAGQIIKVELPKGFKWLKNTLGGIFKKKEVTPSEETVQKVEAEVVDK